MSTKVFSKILPGYFTLELTEQTKQILKAAAEAKAQGAGTFRMSRRDDDGLYEGYAGKVDKETLPEPAWGESQ